MRFLSPEYFNWLVVCLVMGILAILMFKRSQKKLKGTFQSRILKVLTQDYSPKKARIRVLLDVLVVAFLVFTLARPQSGRSTVKQKSEGLEVIFAIDVSPSMTVEDIRPNRLEFVKIEASRLLDKLEGSKIGVLALAGSSSLLCPMTADLSALKMYIDGLTVDSVSAKGTDFKSAFDETMKAFKEGGTDGETETQSGASKVLVLFSDGENHEEGAKEAVSAIAKTGVKIFTVTVGTQKGGAIPERDALGYLRGYKKDRSGQTILSTSRPELMSEMAEMGGGAAYYFTPGGNEAERLLEDLNKLEKGEFDSREVTQYEEKFQPFLLFTILLALLNLILGTKSPLGRVWKGRFEEQLH